MIKQLKESKKVIKIISDNFFGKCGFITSYYYKILSNTENITSEYFNYSITEFPEMAMETNNEIELILKNKEISYEVYLVKTTSDVIERRIFTPCLVKIDYSSNENEDGYEVERLNRIENKFKNIIRMFKCEILDAGHKLSFEENPLKQRIIYKSINGKTINRRDVANENLVVCFTDLCNGEIWLAEVIKNRYNNKQIICKIEINSEHKDEYYLDRYIDIAAFEAQNGSFSLNFVLTFKDNPSEWRKQYRKLIDKNLSITKSKILLLVNSNHGQKISDY